MTPLAAPMSGAEVGTVQPLLFPADRPAVEAEVSVWTAGADELHLGAAVEVHIGDFGALAMPAGTARALAGLLLQAAGGDQ